VFSLIKSVRGFKEFKSAGCLVLNSCVKVPVLEDETDTFTQQKRPFRNVKRPLSENG